MTVYRPVEFRIDIRKIYIYITVNRFCPFRVFKFDKYLIDFSFNYYGLPSFGLPVVYYYVHVRAKIMSLI